MTDTTNPKDLLGVKKAPLRFVPPALVIEVAPAMANGAAKYGPFNWREKAVRSSIYGEAIQRHLLAWMDGEEVAADSGVKHLAHIGACVAILLDAAAHGNMIDDRPTPGPAPRLLAEQDHTQAPAGPTRPAPDALCTTLPDGSCVGVGCMHDPIAERRAAFSATHGMTETAWARAGCACTPEMREAGHAHDCPHYDGGRQEALDKG